MAEMYELITTHEEDAKDRQVWQYESSDNFNSLIKIHADRMQILEDVLNDLLTLRSVSAAEGVQVDKNGEYYQVTRDGDNDTDYRARQKSEVGRVQRAGQVEILLSSLRSLSDQPNVSLIQVFPATNLMHIFVDDLEDVTDQQAIKAEMDRIKAAGVNLVIGVQLNSSAFVFQSDSASGGSNNSGFATLIDGSDGGNFPQILG